MDIPALPFLQVPQFAQIPSQPIENLKSIAEHLKKRRLELYLKQAEVAKDIGVSEDCITYWENNRSQPQIKYYPKIIQFLGYNPFPVDESTLGGKIKKYRIEQGLSLKKLGKTLKVNISTVGAWESHEHIPNAKKLKILEQLFKQ